MSYQMTDGQITAIGYSADIISMVSVVFCLFVLISSAWVYTVPEARHTIDRISFRLMVWSMIFGLGYDVCYFLAEPRFNIFSPSSVDCKVVMYFQIVTMGAVNYFITCIAVNLMLSICFAFNSLTMRLERWYVGISLSFAFIVPIVPAALGHFGADPVYQACYFTAHTTSQRIRHFVLDVYIWQSLAILIACASVVATLVTLFRSGRATARALLRQGHHSTSEEKNPMSNGSSRETEKCGGMRLRKLLTGHSETSATYRLQDQFLSIAIRVSLYPAVLVVINTVLTVGDLYLSVRGGVHTRAEYGLYIVYYVFYGARNLFLAVIGIFVDPGLSRGIGLAWRVTRHRERMDHGRPDISDAEEGDMDFLSALSSTPEPPTRRTPSLQVLSLDRHLFAPKKRSTGGSVVYTQSFQGVDLNSLPVGMTDDVDVDVDVEVDAVGGCGGGEDVVGRSGRSTAVPLVVRTPPSVLEGEEKVVEDSTQADVARRKRRRQVAAEQNLEDLLQRL